VRRPGAVTTYANGVRAEWTGPPGSDSPASVTVIAGEQTGGLNALAGVLAGLALVMSVIALAMAWRRRAMV
jgi:hypothetical protein